jgi:hypothetical protein
MRRDFSMREHRLAQLIAASKKTQPAKYRFLREDVICPSI